LLIELLIHLILTSILILIIAKQVRGIEVDTLWAAVCGAVALGLINVIVFPVVAFITLPFTILTFGLFLVLIHACLFKFSAAIVSGFRVNGFVPALYGSILLTLFDLLISIFI
jgi:putative membrane protein|tara:strand:- start:760 stop:1098 length:339 start_codon:yes stop_codon:yes gene_type:complete